MEGIDFIEGNGVILSAKILWAIFFVAVFLYIIISSIFVFHWNRYGGGERKIKLMQGIYFAVSGFLVLLALGSLFAFLYS